MTWGFIARLLGPILPFLAAWFAGRRDASQRAKIRGLEADNKALENRERIENDVANDPDLAARARKSGIVRKPRQ